MVEGANGPEAFVTPSLSFHAIVPVYWDSLIVVVFGAFPAMGAVTLLLRFKSFTAAAVAGKVIVTVSAVPLPAGLVTVAPVYTKLFNPTPVKV
jgi:hypothetical protein